MVKNEGAVSNQYTKLNCAERSFWSDIPTYHCHSHGGISRN